MKPIPAKIECLKGADQICGFVKEDPKQILYLIEHEALPAWKRNGERTWRALSVDLYNWMMCQRNKYLKNTPKLIESEKVRK